MSDNAFVFVRVFVCHHSTVRLSVESLLQPVPGENARAKNNDAHKIDPEQLKQQTSESTNASHR